MGLATQEHPTLYEQLLELPENLVAEIICGEIHTQPRPAGPHAIASSGLGADLLNAYQRGRGGPGGWWIVDEPEVHFVRDIEVLVPDIAGWRRERLPRIPRDQRFEVAPDWVCEVVAPSSAKKDRTIKPPVYAKYGVAWMWLVDPLARTLEVFALQDGQWVVAGLYKDQDRVGAEPFSEVELQLNDLWVDEEAQSDALSNGQKQDKPTT